MNPTSNVVDRIRKLLNVAERNNSVEEAALAASMAQDLMFKHQIRDEDLVVPETAPEPIDDQEVLATPRYETWKGRLLVHIASSMGAKLYSWYGENGGNGYRVIGLQSGSYENANGS